MEGRREVGVVNKRATRGILVRELFSTMAVMVDPCKIKLYRTTHTHISEYK